jgi:ADP-ribosylglycohydrolase
MPYFHEVHRQLDSLLLWADLRHEQGNPAVGADMKRLSRQLAALTRKYERLLPSAKLRAAEPNDLPAIQAARPPGPRRIWARFDAGAYAERLAGAWLARAAGCTLGAAVEGWPVERMENLARHCRMSFPPTDYWTYTPDPWVKRYGMSPFADSLRQNLRHVPVDDDLTYTLLGLLILEEYGPGFTTADVGRAWLKYLPMAYTAEKVTLDNLRAGADWRRAGVKANPYVEWIGADIRADPWGYAAPGWPQKAAELAYRDAVLSHRQSGIYGEMYFAATVAAAFTVDHPLDACRIALSEIPARCRLHADVAWALRQAPRVKDFRRARALVDERFAGMSSVHTNNNACLTIFGLAIGGRDVTKVIGSTVAMGLDNDCTAATAGSIVGAVVGAAGVPEHWTKPFGGKVRTYMKGREWFTVPAIVKRFANVAKAVAGAV